VESGCKFPVGYARDELGIGGDVVGIYAVLGDSGFNPEKPDLPGSLRAGDRVLIDLGDRTPSPPGHFLCFDGAGAVVRLLELVTSRRTRVVRMSTLNPRYAPTEVRESEINIIGRVRARISPM
jgi:phosphoribosyl 1,2-cyclic phosphodiesterase